MPPTRKAEKTQNAPTVIPLSIGIWTLLNGSLDFVMLLALLFCMPSDIQSILNSETYYPFMNVYTYAVRSTSGAAAIVRPFNSCCDVPCFLNALCHPDLPVDNTTKAYIHMDRFLVRFRSGSRLLRYRRLVSSSSHKYSPQSALSQRRHKCCGLFAREACWI